MAKHKIRRNKTCQNCGAYVDNNFCPKCGQENSESRQSFLHVFTHFVSDLLHYDGSFWRTSRYLLFYPGKLSKEYMDGKRKSYVNPFTLYIFISFFAFFIPAVLPDASEEEKKDFTDRILNSREFGTITSFSQIDSIRQSIILEENMIAYMLNVKNALNKKIEEIEKDTLESLSFNKKTSRYENIYSFSQYDSVKRLYNEKQQIKFNSSLKEDLYQYITDIYQQAHPNPRGLRIKITKYGRIDSFEKFDSIKTTLYADAQMDRFDNLLPNMVKDFNKKMEEESKEEKLREGAIHNISKILFIYMPIFAFLLWLFHNKKKRYYFDSAIFTLHFFSILLLLVTISYILIWAEDFWDLEDTIDLTIWSSLISVIYITYYFFKAHKVFYQEKGIVSAIKVITLIMINNILIPLVAFIYLMFFFYLYKVDTIEEVFLFLKGMFK